MIYLKNKDSGEILYLDGTSFSYTKQIGDIQDLTKANASFSPSFNIPETFNNIGVLKGLGLIGSTSKMPYKSVLWDLYIDGIPTVIDTELIVTETSGGKYSSHLKQGVVSFFKDIQADTISEAIDLSELEHENSTFEIIESWSNTKPYKYIVADYNNVQLSKISGVTNLSKAGIHPSLNIKWLIDKIFNTYGWTYELTPDISDLWLTYPTALEYDEGDLLNVLNSQVAPEQSTTGELNLRLTNSIVNPNYFESVDFGLGYKALISGDYILNLDLIYEAYNISSPNTQIISDVLIDIDGVRSPYILGVPRTFGITVNQVVRIFIKTYNLQGVDVINVVSGEFNIYETNVQQISFVDAFIDFNVSDFIKEMTVRLCASYVTDVANKHIKFLTLTERLEASRNNVSKYFVKRLKESYSIAGYAKENTFSINYHNDLIGKYADASFKLTNENLDSTIELFESHFTAALNYTTNYQLSDNVNAIVPVLPMYDIKVNKNNDTGDVTIDFEPLESRFYMIRDYISNADIYIEGIKYSNLPIATLSKSTLRYFVDVYWKDIGRILNNPLVHYVELNLHMFNIDKLPLDEVAELTQEGSRYLVNRIEYKTGDLVKAELIKIR